MPHYKSGPGYTILNSFYFSALRALGTELEREDIPYAFVGGTAIQLRVADILGGNGAADIKGIGGLDVLLRRTGDIDVATIANHGQIVSVVNMLTHLSPFDAELRGGGLARLTRRTREHGIDDVILVNIYTGVADVRGLGDHYEPQITTAEEVIIRKGNEQLIIRVPTLAYCMATKLMRGEEKDKIDVHGLLKACTERNVPFHQDLEEARSILKSIGKEDRFSYIREIAYDLSLPRAVSLTGDEGVKVIS